MENIWTSPVTDRSQSDVDYIKSLSDKIISFGFTSLSEEEQYFWWYGENSELVDLNSQLLFDNNDLQLIVGSGTIKGAVNITDLNRIDSNTNYLKLILESYGFNINCDIKETSWENYELLTLSELDRIKNNVILLLEGYYSTGFDYNSLIILGKNVLNYIDLNNIELGLYIIDDLLNKMITGFRYCGTFNCGQTIILP